MKSKFPNLLTQGLPRNEVGPGVTAGKRGGKYLGGGKGGGEKKTQGGKLLPKSKEKKKSAQLTLATESMENSRLKGRKVLAREKSPNDDNRKRDDRSPHFSCTPGTCFPPFLKGHKQT